MPTVTPAVTRAYISQLAAAPSRATVYRSCVHAPSTSLTSDTLTKPKNSLAPHLEHVLGGKGKHETNKKEALLSVITWYYSRPWFLAHTELDDM